ncbi:hypothetical protein GOP47_0020923 [Adiantum capillus-veneris]|uniref:Uncharacterized protein n=1 Tax=Adiantum capillus-veneris TaxID=13818 RepID=A0A9D4Z6K1_ADICA|nr:hypothetical protein GOP47_0020923 [Adiantum capillus-veneris]
MAARGASTAGEEERFHGLPPLKRFKILEKERVQQKRGSEASEFTANITAQKSEESGVKVLCCLPAKKRVCALQVFAHVEEEEQENKKSPLLAQKLKPVVPVRPLQPIDLNCEPLSDQTPAKERIATKKSKQSMDTSSVAQGNAEMKHARERMQKRNLLVMAEKSTTAVKLASVKKVGTSVVSSVTYAPGVNQMYVDPIIISTVEQQKMEPKPPRRKGEADIVTPNFTIYNPKMLIAEGEAVASINLEKFSTDSYDRDLTVKLKPEDTMRAVHQQKQQKKKNKTDMSSVTQRQNSYDEQASGDSKQIDKGAINCKDEGKYADLEQKEESDGEDDGIFCDVCKEADAEPSDPIVFCDGCNVMVHASCYGSPLIEGIPDGDWFCRQCEQENRRKKADEGSKEGHVGYHVGQRTCASRVCCLCPSRKGAMKQTTSGAWAHLSCALYVPEVFYNRARDREEIECGSVPAWRWELPCEVCSTWGQGSCIQCTEVGCSSTFHVSCALDAGLSIDYRNANALTKTPAIVIAFCSSHSKQALTSSERRRFKIVPRC